MNFSKTLWFFSSGVLIASANATSSAQAAIMNGSFDGTLNDWTTLGNVGLNSTNDGALLTTLSSITESDVALDNFLNVSSNPLNITGGGFYGIVGGSALSQNFVSSGGETLSFDWNFLTNEDSNFFSNFDGAYFTLVNTDTNAENVSLLADVTSAVVFPGSESFAFETGFNTFSSSPLAAGNYLLGFAVFDDLDTDPAFSSGLLIDNVKLNAVSQPIPEPSSILGSFAALLLLGSVALTRLKKRKKQHNNNSYV